MADKTDDMRVNRKVITGIECRKSDSFGGKIFIYKFKSIIQSIVQINISIDGQVFADLIFEAPVKGGVS